MNKYENIIIIKGTFTDDEYKKAFEKAKQYFKNFKNVKIEEIGKKRLAYEINKEKYGYYVIFELETEPEEIRELERLYRINDDILKFLTIRKDD